MWWWWLFWWWACCGGGDGGRCGGGGGGCCYGGGTSNVPSNTHLLRLCCFNAIITFYNYLFGNSETGKIADGMEGCFEQFCVDVINVWSLTAFV